MARQGNIDTSIYVNDFSKGINNLINEKNIDNNSLSQAVNIDITKDGRIQNREGWKYIREVQNGHSLWSDNINMYFCENDNLIKLDKNNQEQIIDSGFYTKNKTSFIKDNQSVILSNSKTIKRYYKNKIYNIAPEKFKNDFTCTIIPNGLLTKGRYLVACTFLFDNNIEGGTSNPIEVTINQDNVGISISKIAETFDINITQIRVYISRLNSNQLMQYGDYNISVDSINIMNDNSLGKILDVISFDVLESGILIEKYKNCIFTSKENKIYVSEPLMYLQNGFYYEFEGDITLLISTTDGLYVSDEYNLYFLSGNNPQDLSRELIYNSPAVIYTHSKNIMTNEIFFFTQMGQIVAESGGKIKNITSDRFLPNKEILSGASLYKYKNGIQQIITSFESGENTQNGIGTWATVEIERAS